MLRACEPPPDSPSSFEDSMMPEGEEGEVMRQAVMWCVAESSDGVEERSCSKRERA